MSKFLYYEQCPRCESNGRDSKKDNAAVYSDGSKHCFACSWHQFPKYYVRKPIENINTKDKAKLPNDFSRDVPAKALKWLLSFGLPYSYWKEAIGYSEEEGRLIFRVGDTEVVNGRTTRTSNPLAFSIGRLVEERPLPNGKQPRKWVVWGDKTGCFPVSPQTQWGDAHKHAEIVGASSSRQIILVEDLLSAHKVAAGGFTAVPLFGTNISNPMLYYMLAEQKPIVLWLDADQRGNVIRKAVGLQNITGLQVKTAFSERDPKELDVETIKGIING